MAYVDIDGAAALAAAETIPADASIDDVFLQNHCLQVVQAIAALVEWLQKPA
jgi:hypothetical protein